MRLLRQTIRQTLRKVGFGTFKIGSSELLNFENYLYAVLLDRQIMNFVHVGAHDGKSFTDPLYRFINRYPNNTQGVLIEPVPATFQKLVKNLGGLPGLQFLNEAIHPSLRKVILNRLVGVEKSHEQYVTGLVTFYRSRLETPELLTKGGVIEPIEVPARPIMDVISMLPREDKFSPHVVCIDTEGLDFEIVSSINFEEWTPLIMRFEHNLCELRGHHKIEEYLSLVEKLNLIGYQIITESNDAIAVHERMIPLIAQLESVNSPVNVI